MKLPHAFFSLCAKMKHVAGFAFQTSRVRQEERVALILWTFETLVKNQKEGIDRTLKDDPIHRHEVFERHFGFVDTRFLHPRFIFLTTTLRSSSLPFRSSGLYIQRDTPPQTDPFFSTFYLNDPP